MEAIVEFDYAAKEPDELTIRKGDVIKDVVDMGGGWCQGVLGDKRGMFPDNFVKMLGKAEKVTLRSKKDIAKVRQCRVVFSYRKDHEDELNLDRGDIVDVIGEEEEGWWRGILHGKEGVFPSNFVEEITNNKSRNSSKEDLNLISEGDSKSPSLPPKPAKIFCEVKYAYEAQNADELTFKEGDVITLISKDGQDPGWWKGELNGQIGVFPDNFVVIRPSNEDVLTKEEKRCEKAAQDATPKRQKPMEKADGEGVNKVTPPIPGKKPILPIKKSPSGSSSSGGLFSGLKKKLVDAVDGSSISKSSHSPSKNVDNIKVEKTEESSGDAFDQVERNAILSDVRATRVKAPGRRPPSVVFKEVEPGVMNGNTDHGALDSVTESGANSSATTDDEIVEVKPKMREWEKHKAPWLEEMKLNQAKRTSTSPGPEQNRYKLTPDKADDEPKSAKTSPYESPSPVDMTKSMPAFSTRFKTSPNEVDKTITPQVRTKPLPTTSARPQTIHAMSPSSNNESPSAITKLPPKVSPNVANKLVSPSTKPQVIDKHTEKASGDAAQETVPFKQYYELVQRIEKLEALVKEQHQTSMTTIEELKGKLQVEREMRMMLQAEINRISQCVMQV